MGKKEGCSSGSVCARGCMVCNALCMCSYVCWSCPAVFLVPCSQVKAGVQQIKYFIDPRTGQEVAINESSEHMRVNLLDPRWQEEKRRNLDKHRGTGLTTGEDIAANLAGFAKKRPDIFGGDELADEKKGPEKVCAAFVVVCCGCSVSCCCCWSWRWVCFMCVVEDLAGAVGWSVIHGKGCQGGVCPPCNGAPP